MEMIEDSYGRLKRQEFIDAAIREFKAHSVLDYGCGTGTQLTVPMAELHPEVSFVGVDSDQASIDWARELPRLSNLVFVTEDDLSRHFDLVIVSEVLEHVDAPDELLAYLRSRLAENGHLIVTTPNGYGPFETAQLIENLGTVSGLLPMLRSIKRWLRGTPPLAPVDTMTLAVSPHVNFFSRSDIDRLFREAGLRSVRYRSRTVFCGFIFDRLMRGALLDWNGRIADRLPAWCASDWMYVCEPVPLSSPVSSTWRRNAWGRFRRRLSERRWAGIALPYH